MSRRDRLLPALNVSKRVAVRLRFPSALPFLGSDASVSRKDGAIGSEAVLPSTFIICCFSVQIVAERLIPAEMKTVHFAISKDIKRQYRRSLRHVFPSDAITHMCVGARPALQFT
jgi:hypothetical protein